MEGLEVPDEDVLDKKIRSEGVHPYSENLKVEFSAVGRNWEEAKEGIVKKIDHYLDDHNLKEFDFDKLNLKS